MRSRSWLVAVFVVMAVQMSPVLEKVSAQSGPGIVISELRFSGPNGVSDEFIELFNAGDADIDISGWEVRVSGSPVDGQLRSARRSRPTPAACRTGLLLPDHLHGRRDSATPVGRSAITPTPPASPMTVVWQSGPSAHLVPTRSASTPERSTSSAHPDRRRYRRLHAIAASNAGRAAAHGHVDTNNNAADFQLIVESIPQVTHVPNPQNSASPCVSKPA